MSNDRREEPSLLRSLRALIRQLAIARASAYECACATAEAWVAVVHPFTLKTAVLPASSVWTAEGQGVRVRFCRAEQRVVIETDDPRVSAHVCRTRPEAERWMHETWVALVNLGVTG